MCPNPRVWFLDAKQRLLGQNNKSLWVPDIPVVLCMQNGVISTRITSLYGSQPSSVVFNAKQRLLDLHTNLYGFQTSPVALCMKNSDFRTGHTSPYGSQISSVALSRNNTVLSTRIKRLYLFQPAPVVFACKTAPSEPE